MGIFGTIGNFFKKALPAAASFIPGIGPIAGGALGAIMNSIGGGDAAKGGLEGFGTASTLQALLQQGKDSKRARELIEQAVGQSNEAADIAREEFRLDAPMRQGFRQGALNFADPTNPFARSQGQALGNPFLGGFDPNSKFNESLGISPAPTPGFFPSSGLGGSGGFPQPSPGVQGQGGGIFGSIMGPLQQLLQGGGQTPGFNPNAASPGFVPRTAGPMGSLANRIEQRFGSQERGSGTDFITPSRRASSIKRAI
jgi:hypothetical protein